ncbi:MAG: hypothetical protein KJ069_07945 [Anaerolineae bacterium]|nr:hypothetical protein [Anaerolineae bacterium]
MNKMRLFPIFAVLMLFLAVIMAACAPEVEREPASEVVTAVVTRPATHTAVPTHTPTSIPTYTPTPLPTHTNTPTAIPTSTPTLIPTPEVLDSYTSPSGEWVATLEEGYFFDEPDTYLFRVISTDGTVEWVVEYAAEPDGSLLGYSRRIPLHWSEDGQYMYYIHDAAGDGCGPDSYGYNLYRFNLETGENIELIPEGHWFAIAPNEEKVAFILDDELVIHNLTTGEEVISPFDLSRTHQDLFPYYSYLVWSPDSSSLLVRGAEDVCHTGMLDGRIFIIQVDPQSLIQNTIFEFSPWLEIVAWQELDKVLLSISIGNAQSSNAWLNPETGEITPADE